jgi:alkaline phosphatase D
MPTASIEHEATLQKAVHQYCRSYQCDDGLGGREDLPSRLTWKERRDLFSEGVASGDPATDSILLWTRYSAGGTTPAVSLTVEVAEDPAFESVVATAGTRALAAADHTCRVLVGGLRPGQIYWYRFATESGEGSRVGRTRTAHPANDPRPVRFTFVSCQNVCEGAQNAYRRMIFEDEHAPAEEQLAFVLHLGDFIYEVVDYPEDRPGGRRYDRRLRDRVRYPDGEKIGKFRVAAPLADYRSSTALSAGPGFAGCGGASLRADVGQPRFS